MAISPIICRFFSCTNFSLIKLKQMLEILMKTVLHLTELLLMKTTEEINITYFYFFDKNIII